MADPVIPSDPKDPAKPGNETSEFSLTRLVAILGTIVAVSVPVLTAVVSFLTQIQDAFPGARWIGAGIAAAGAMLGVASAVGKYSTGRSDIKVATIRGASVVQAAEARVANPPQ